MKKILFILFSFLLLNVGHGQVIELTDKAEISIITVAPGNNLVDSFGHSAFRVKDNSLGIDLAYNYGMYDFNTPNFYGKFAQGKLLYQLGSGPFYRFLRFYTNENRNVDEQVMDLSFEDRQLFFEFLENNAKPENRSYLYDFLFDNCATKLRDVSKDILKEKIQFNYDFLEGQNFTFRNLIHQHLDSQPWGKFGIDLALGSVIDRKARPEEYQFLPKYVFKAFENGSIANKPLIKNTSALFNSVPREKQKHYFTPIVVLSIFVLFGLLITLRDYKNNKRTKWFDFLLFFSTGIVGLLVLLLWTATDHTATANNFNVLWAFPPNLLLAFVFLKKGLKPWVKKYLIVVLLLLVTTFILWFLKVQAFATALVPVLGLLIVRYLFLSSRFKRFI